MERKREPDLLPFLLEIKVILSKISLALGRHVPSRPRGFAHSSSSSSCKEEDKWGERKGKKEEGVITVALVGSPQDVLWNAGSGGQNWTAECPQPKFRRPVLILAVTFEARRLKAK